MNGLGGTQVAQCELHTWSISLILTLFSVYYYNKKVKRSNEITEPVRSDHWKPEERDIYESLCRGETDQPEGLICYYHHGKPDNYYLQLGPVRTEELFKSPYVVRFLDVYSGIQS